MELTEDRKAWLAAQYHTWGLETVRRELTRKDRDTFTDPDVTEFAETWVKGEERALRRKKLRGATLTFAAILMIGAGLGAIIKF